MFDRIQLLARGATIVLIFVSSGYAQADDANEYLSAVRAELEIADVANVSTTNRTDLTATADVDGDQADVIEEIVVIGRKKGRFQKPGNSLGSYPVVQKPGRINWQFLSKYDPQQAYPYFDQVQLNEEIRRAGVIELFRVRFGR